MYIYLIPDTNKFQGLIQSLFQAVLTGSAEIRIFLNNFIIKNIYK